jgi:hypothetical protein
VSKTALALMILIPCAILAIPAWLLMRALNERAVRERARRDEADSSKWDAEMAKVRQEMKR